MTARIRHRSPGSWQISHELGLDSLGRCKAKAVNVRGTKADAQRKLRELLTALDQSDGPEHSDIPLYRDSTAGWRR